MKKLIFAALVAVTSVASAQHYDRGHMQPYGGRSGPDHPIDPDRRELRQEFFDVRDRLIRNIDRAERDPRCRQTVRQAGRAIRVHDDNIQMFRQQYGRVPTHQWTRMTDNLRDHNRVLRQSGCVERGGYR